MRVLIVTSIFKLNVLVTIIFITKVYFATYHPASAVPNSYVVVFYFGPTELRLSHQPALVAPNEFV